MSSSSIRSSPRIAYRVAKLHTDIPTDANSGSAPAAVTATTTPPKRNGRKRGQSVVELTPTSVADGSSSSSSTSPPSTPPKRSKVSISISTSKPTKSTPKSKKSKPKKSPASASAYHSSPTAVGSVDDGKFRCWASSGDMRDYHDSNWGRTGYHLPTTNHSYTSNYTQRLADTDYQLKLQRTYEQLCLQSMQAGISWRIIFNKVDSLRSAFDSFDPRAVSLYSNKKLTQLLSDPGVIRHERKLKACIANAKAIIRLEQEYEGGFFHWIYQTFKDDKGKDVGVGEMKEKERKLSSGKMPCSGHMRTDMSTAAINRFESDGVHPTRTVAHLVKRMKKEGFEHLGETSILCWLEAIGCMNHHATKCFAHEECEGEWELVTKARQGK